MNKMFKQLGKLAHSLTRDQGREVITLMRCQQRQLARMGHTADRTISVLEELKPCLSRMKSKKPSTFLN